MDANQALDEVIAQHKALKNLLASIQEQFDAPIVNAKTIHSMLNEARSEIIDHFDHEEEEFFDQVVANAPWLKSRSDELRSQHADFRIRLDRIVTELEHSTEFTLFDVSREFDAFLVDYFRHEGQENALVQEAFTRDVGTKD